MKGYDGRSIFENQETENAGNGFSLDAFVRNAAQRMIEGALDAEVTEFLGRLRGERADGADGFTGYRNGYHAERTVTTAVGALCVRQPRVSDVPEGVGRFRSKLIVPYRRRTEGLDAAFTRLFVEGLSTRDFEPALRALIGEEAPLSPSSVSRLNKRFKDDYEAWKTRRLDGLEIVYVWVDGVYLKAGIADEKLCALVMIGADRSGTKHLLGLREGYRESRESWLSLLRDLRDRGMNAPAVAVADGGLGFWAALPEVWPHTKEQLCWLHKTRNILDKLPKKEHQEAADRLRAVYLAEDRENAEGLARKLLADWRQTGYLQAAECLEKALGKLLTFHSFPTEHARHLRTTNPIESPFSAVKARTNAARRFRTQRPALYLLFKLLERAQKGWQRLSHPEKLKDVRIPGKPPQTA